ncbi:MAG: glycosyltransferase family 39 protein [Terriglobia bacterium]
MNASHSPFPSFTAKAPQIILLIVIAAALFFVRLGRLPLLEPDEGRNAEVAREMLVTHDWITPHYDGLPYLDKPAFLFWSIAGAFRVFGLSEWAARFPAAIAALATVLLAWLLGRRMFGETTGVFAGIILATAPLFFGIARTVVFDMPLTFFVTAALLCFWLNSSRSYASRRLDLLAFAAMGVGALTKGPVAFLLPLITLAVFHACAGTVRELRKLHWVSGWILFLAITLPWFIDVSLRNPGFPKYAFWEESLLRFTTGAHLHRSSSVFYYVPLYFAGFFPWSFFLLFSGWKRLRAWRTLREEARRAELFLLVWAAVIFVFFTLSRSKLPGYVLPALIPLSILAARGWQPRSAADWRIAPRGVPAGFVALIVCGVLIALLPYSFHFIMLSAHAASRLPFTVVHLLRPGLLRGGVVMLALGVFGWRHIRRGSRRWPSFAAAALAVPLLAILLRTPLALYARINSSKEVAQTIDASPGKDLPVYGYYYFRTGLPFYLRRPVGLVTEEGGQTTSNYIAARFSTFLDAPAANISASSAPALLTRGPLIDGAQFRQLLDRQTLPFLLMARNGFVAKLLSDDPRMEPRWTAWRFSVLEVRWPRGSAVWRPGRAGLGPLRSLLSRLR